MSAIQYIETGFEVKAVEADGTFTGYAGVFGNIDSHRDILLPGSTKVSIETSKGLIPILAGHDTREQIGWNQKATEDSVGILVQGALNLSVKKAVEIHALAKQAMDLGAPFGLSIGYLTKDYAIDETERVRKLKEIDLKEYSFVAFPSNTRANVLSIKSIAKELGEFDVTSNPKALEGILREVGFSVSVSKKVATTAMALHSKTTDESLRDVDKNEAKDVLEALRLMNASLELSSMR